MKLISDCEISSPLNVRAIIQNNNNIIVKELKDKEEIDNHTYKKLICHNGVCSKMYSLVKIHKVGNPLRLTISSIESPTII